MMLFPVLFLTLSAAPPQTKSLPVSQKIAFIPTPEETKNTPVNFMSELGKKADFFCNRIRFKISYSFYKSREYFTLAASAPADAVPAHKRDLKSRLNIKKDQMRKDLTKFREEAVNKGKEQWRKGSEELSERFQKHKETVTDELQKMGKEFKKEARDEFNRQTDGYFK